MKKIVLITIVLLISNTIFAQDLTIKHHYISWKMSDMILERASFQYQFITGKEGKIGIYIPFSIHFGEYPHYNDNEPISEFVNEFFNEDEAEFYSGIGVRIYPVGQKMPFDFSIGTEVRLGKGNHVVNDENYDNLEPIYKYESYTYSAFLIVPGFKYDIMNNLVISIEIGVGLRNGQNNIDIMSAPGFYFGFFF